MVLEVTDDTFEEVVLKSDIPVLVDFWAPWCGPCRALAPMVDELSKEYDVRVLIIKINVDENPITIDKYMIRSIPTLILFQNGEIVKQVIRPCKEHMTNLLDDTLTKN